MFKPLLLKNCKIYSDYENELYQDILIKDGKIADIGRTIHLESAETLNIDKRIVTPGFIDIHIHGAGGVDATNPDPDKIHIMTETLAELGTTNFLATPVFVQEKSADYFTSLTHHENDGRGANIVGIHVEGPFVNRKKNGGMQQSWIKKPSEPLLRDILTHTNGRMKMMTIAPELDQDFNLIQTLEDADVIPAMGHTMADYEETQTFINGGIRHITHLYNAMQGIHHRAPGPLVAIFENEEVTVQLISDGRHVSPEIIRWTVQQIGTDRIITITDGMEGTGLPDGIYNYNGREYESRDGTAYYMDGTFIGSTMGLARHVINFWRYSEATFEQAVHTGTLNPARLLGIEDRKGSIATGKDADIVILDENYEVDGVIIGGNIIKDLS